MVVRDCLDVITTTGSLIFESVPSHKVSTEVCLTLFSHEGSGGPNNSEETVSVQLKSLHCGSCLPGIKRLYRCVSQTQRRHESFSILPIELNVSLTEPLPSLLSQCCYTCYSRIIYNDNCANLASFEFLLPAEITLVFRRLYQL